MSPLTSRTLRHLLHSPVEILFSLHPQETLMIRTNSLPKPPVYPSLLLTFAAERLDGYRPHFGKYPGTKAPKAYDEVASAILDHSWSEQRRSSRIATCVQSESLGWYDLLCRAAPERHIHCKINAPDGRDPVTLRPSGKDPFRFPRSDRAAYEPVQFSNSSFPGFDNDIIRQQ